MTLNQTTPTALSAPHPFTRSTSARARAIGLLLACGLMPACSPDRVRSLVDDLRFVAASVEPPEIAPGDEISVSWEIADPGQNRDLQYFFLPCTTYYGFSGCLEAYDLLRNPSYVNDDGTLNEEGYRAYFQTYARRGQTRPGRLDFTLTTAFAPMLLLGGMVPPGSEPLPTVDEVEGQVSLLVCPGGPCDALLDELDAYLADEPIDRTGAELLADVSTGAYLADLPFEDNAWAVKSYLFSLRDPSERNHNPEPISVALEKAPDNTPAPGMGGPGAGGPPSQTGVEGERYQLTLSLSADSLELLPPDAVEETSPTPEPSDTPTPTPAPAYETLTVHWFSTVGSISPQRQDVTDLETPIQTTLTLTADELSRLSSSEQTLYVSVTDPRRGCDWIAQPLILP